MELKMCENERELLDAKEQDTSSRWPRSTFSPDLTSILSAAAGREAVQAGQVQLCLVSDVSPQVQAQSGQLQAGTTTADITT